MRYWGIAAGVALGAALGLSLGEVGWTLDPGRVQRDLSVALGPTLYLSRASLTLLPRPTLHLTALKWRARDGALTAEAAQADVTLRIDRLLTGVIAPLGIALQGARLSIDADKAVTAFKALPQPPIARLVVNGGTVEIAARRRNWSTRLDIAAARIDWASGDGPLRATLSGRWRLQPVEATVEIDAPLAAARGESSAVRASLDAPLAQLRVAGDWSPQGAPDGSLYLGQISALIPSLARFGRWLGESPAPGPAPAGLELQAKVSADLKQLKLTDAVLALGGQSFEGALDVLKTESAVSVSGTLAADALDLEPLIGPPPPLIDSAGGWSKEPALPRPSDRVDLDLRVSATRAVWRGHALENAAAAVSQRDGRFSIKLLEAEFARGSLSGEMSVQATPGGCESRFSLALDDADLGALLGSFGERNFEGEGALRASFKARGRSPADIVASADGEGSLEIADGALRRLNFEEALRRGQRRLIDVARDMAAGATRFGAAHGRLEISNGEARFVDAATQGPGVALSLTGAIDLAARAWRARVVARQSSEDGLPTPDGAHLEFALYGPWSGPVFVPILSPAD